MSVWDKSWVLLLAVAACDSADQPVAAAAGGVSARQPADKPTLLEGERGLRLLAWVNQPDLRKAKPYKERHALIDQLSASADARHIDRRLNLALDLRQASEAPDPCGTYGTALGRISESDDAYFSGHVQAAAPPSGCAELGPERDKVLAALTEGAEAPAPDEEADDAPAESPTVATVDPPATPSKPTGRQPKKRGSTPSGSKTKTRTKTKTRSQPTPVTDSTPTEPSTPKTRPNVASKIDEELKPFGL